jgi:polysaccharide biosynthesis protein PslG
MQPAYVAANPATGAAPAIAAMSAVASATATKTHPATPKVAPRRTSGTAVAPAPGVPNAAVSGATVYGFSAPELLDDSSPVAQLEAMKAVGVTSVRLDADWYYTQPSGPNSYDWTTLDQVVGAIRQVGLSADLIIDGCPPWAAVSSAKGDEFAQPADPAQFAAFAGAVAARYGSKGVKYFEIWNEPNLPEFWDPTPDVAAYTQDLIAAYAAIKAADPAAIVISGGLAPAADTATSYDPRTFLADMYADGAKGSFDGVGDHPYSYPASPDNGLSAWSQMDETSPSLRSIMAENGDSAKKIWITEYGAPTIGPSAVSETDQSDELVDAISDVKKISWIGSFYIYTWSDIAGSPSEDNGFGLLTEDNTQKPAYSAVAAALAS